MSHRSSIGLSLLINSDISRQLHNFLMSLTSVSTVQYVITCVWFIIISHTTFDSIAVSMASNRASGGNKGVTSLAPVYTMAVVAAAKGGEWESGVHCLMLIVLQLISLTVAFSGSSGFSPCNGP